MNSQVSNIKTVTVAITEVSVGDIVHGVNQQTWLNSYMVYEGPVQGNGGYLTFIVGRTGSEYEDERTPWYIHKDNPEVLIEDRTFQYDPRQAGDTDEDI